MDEIEKLPYLWRPLFQSARVKSQRDLAEQAGLGVGTVNRMINGKGRPDVESVRKVAKVLSDGNADPIWIAIDSGQRDYGDFDLSEVSDELSLLTPHQRTALVALIRSMADPHGKRRTGRGTDKSGPDSGGTVHRLRPFDDEVSAPDESLDEAALETTEGLDESPGGSDPDVE